MGRCGIFLVLSLVVAGCSVGGDREKRGGRQTAEAAAATAVLRLDGLIRARDYGRICADVLTPGARVRAGGARCARQMRVRTAGLSGPGLALQDVRVHGPEVHALVLAHSAGGGTGLRTVVLTRVGRSLRVDGIER